MTKPTVLVDATSLRYVYTGLGQFAWHLLNELQSIPEMEFELRSLVHPRFADRVPAGVQIIPANWLRRHGPSIIQPFLYGRPALWHMTTENTRHRHVPNGVPMVLTIHGLHFLDEWSAQQADIELRRVQQLIDRADIVTTVSDFTRRLVLDKLRVNEDSVRTIPNGIASRQTNAVRPAWAPVQKFIFSMGTFFERKNFLPLLGMMKFLPGYVLVLAGDNNRAYGEAIRKECQRLELNETVLLPGEITDEEKHWLLQEGEAMMFPSLSEGFGIPVLEAMQVGTPVICSKAGSLPEVGSTHAVYWDNFEPEYMAMEVRKMLANDTEALRVQRKQYAESYSWSRTADLFAAVYREVLSKDKP